MDLYQSQQFRIEIRSDNQQLTTYRARCIRNFCKAWEYSILRLYEHKVGNLKPILYREIEVEFRGTEYDLCLFRGALANICAYHEIVHDQREPGLLFADDI